MRSTRAAKPTVAAVDVALRAACRLIRTRRLESTDESRSVSLGTREGVAHPRAVRAAPLGRDAASTGTNARSKEGDVAGGLTIVWRGSRALVHARCRRPMLTRGIAIFVEKTRVVIDVILEISNRGGHMHAT
jgi:hypothetical protein